MRSSAEKVHIQQITIIYYYHMKIDSDLISLVNALTTAQLAVSDIYSKYTQLG
jgi:hypothetical protein